LHFFWYFSSNDICTFRTLTEMFISSDLLNASPTEVFPTPWASHFITSIYLLNLELARWTWLSALWYIVNIHFLMHLIHITLCFLLKLHFCNIIVLHCESWTPLIKVVLAFTS
jgi:hypothetical protein